MKNFFGMLIRLLLTIFMIPVILGLVSGIDVQFANIVLDERRLLTWGIVVYCLVHIFALDLYRIFEWGQRPLLRIFKGTGTNSAILSCSIPVYPLCVTLLYFMLDQFTTWNMTRMREVLLFSFSFFYAMHLAQSARLLADGDPIIFKLQYVSSLGIVIIFSLILMGATLHFINPKFSLKGVCQIAYDSIKGTFSQGFDDMKTNFRWPIPLKGK